MARYARRVLLNSQIIQKNQREQTSSISCFKHLEKGKSEDA